jgi:hypothetical protein
MSGAGIEEVPETFSALIDYQLIAAAEAGVAECVAAHHEEAAACETARSDLDRAASALSALRDAADVSNLEIIRAMRRAEFAKGVLNVRSDRVIAASTRLEKAKLRGARL